MGALKDGHCGVDLGVDVRRIATDLNGDQVARDEGSAIGANGAGRGGRDTHREKREGEDLVMEHHLRDNRKRVS